MGRINRKYPDEFKLHVIYDYYNSTLSVRSIASKYNLPSKNYINNWEEQLKKKGLLPHNVTKSNKTTGRSKDSVIYKDTRTLREKQYEEEIRVLETRIAYLESLESLKSFLKKVTFRELKYKAIMNIEFEHPIWLLCKIAGINRS